MRLTEIKIARDSYSRFIQSLPNGDFSGSVGVQFALRDKEPVARTLGRLVASPALALLRSGAQRKLKTDLGFYADRLAIGERFADDSAWAFLLGRLPPAAGLSVLIPGCYMGGEDVQFWLRRGISLLEGIDVYSLVSSWSSIVPSLRGRWRGSEVNFQQGSIENIPFEDNTFDVISTTAVLEHVRNIGAMVEETARVLKPGGFALHSFGPLYYSYGADHCIAAYGLEAGYDHLLLDEDDYRRRIASRALLRTDNRKRGSGLLGCQRSVFIRDATGIFRYI